MCTLEHAAASRRRLSRASAARQLSGRSNFSPRARPRPTRAHAASSLLQRPLDPAGPTLLSPLLPLSRSRLSLRGLSSFLSFPEEIRFIYPAARPDRGRGETTAGFFRGLEIKERREWDGVHAARAQKKQQRSSRYVHKPGRPPALCSAAFLFAAVRLFAEEKIVYARARSPVHYANFLRA